MLDRIALNKVLDERQAIIGEGNKLEFIAHEDVKKILEFVSAEKRGGQ